MTNVIAELSGMRWGTLDSDRNVVLTQGMGCFMLPEDRRVGNDHIGEIRVSTVFLQVNHGSDNHPLWFETMVFDAEGRDVHCDRYATWDEAAKGHADTVDMVNRERAKVFAYRASANEA